VGSLAPRLVGVVGRRDVYLHPVVEELLGEHVAILDGGAYAQPTLLEHDDPGVYQVALGDVDEAPAPADMSTSGYDYGEYLCTRSDTNVGERPF
jgi:hypothetical protein